MAITNLIYVYATKDNNEHAHSILTMKGQHQLNVMDMSYKEE